MTPRRTLAHPVTASGTALHSGVPVTMTLSPAAAGSGIVFRRADLNVDIPARYDLVSETRLGTVIGSGSAKVGVVEHLMADPGIASFATSPKTAPTSNSATVSDSPKSRCC
jgi:UDP-3-O-[3-hydroxymyristoyl] N-acetylglucosamine deacetylase